MNLFKEYKKYLKTHRAISVVTCAEYLNVMGAKQVKQNVLRRAKFKNIDVEGYLHP